MFLGDIGLQFPFSCNVFAWFHARAIEAGLLRRAGKCHTPFSFPERLVYRWCHFFLQGWVEFTCEALWAWGYSVAWFLHTALIGPGRYFF